MRDPDRIPRIIERLKKIWEGVPDQRLCQLISNLAAMEGKDGDLFYVEDDIIERGMDSWKLS